MNIDAKPGVHAELEPAAVPEGAMTGVARIRAAFDACNTDGRAALMPYFTAGYPDPAASEEILIAVAENGADLIELGVPFSDPLADGPVIQHSTQIALEQGMTPAGCIALMERLRERGVRQPVLLMGYTNPILAYGMERFVRDVREAGGDGLIVPDLPLGEADELEAACSAEDVALVYLAAPTTKPERLRTLAERTAGFLYLVSVTGVTGARESLPTELGAFVERAKAVAHTPVAVGFGISQPEQAAEVARLADGVIVGSALIRAVEAAEDKSAAAGDFVRGLREGVQHARRHA